MRGVFLPLIFWCLKMGENGGFGMLHLVGFNTDVKTPLHPVPIFSIYPRHFLLTSPMKNLTAIICLTIAVLLGSVGVSWSIDYNGKICH